MQSQRWHRRFAAVLAGLAAATCSGDDGSDADPLVARGKTIYANVCTACHAANPSVDGALGPAIAGSSPELVEARLLRGEYPPGYQPKRPSQVMPKFPNLASEIDALSAYLAEAARTQGP